MSKKVNKITVSGPNLKVSPSFSSETFKVSPNIIEDASAKRNQNSDRRLNLEMLDIKVMEEEEEKVKKIDDKEQIKILKQVQHIREENELQEIRYKRLMHLLTKSEFYSQFLLKKIDNQCQSEDAARRNTKMSPSNKENEVSEVRKKSDAPGHESRKRKLDRTGNSDSHENNPKRRKQHDSSYQISKVINKETAEAAKVTTLHSCSQESAMDLEQPQLLSGVVLRQYQQEGFHWLRVMYENGINGLLADEMGLGKTVQSLALLCHLYEMGVSGPFLVVAPLSTLHNWCNEISSFAPQLPFVLFHGTKVVRKEKIRQIYGKHIITVVNSEGLEKVHQVHPIVVTSYRMVVACINDLGSFLWKYIIVDEGHNIKNYQCRLVHALKKYPSSNRLLLTGTPLQNNLAELWSLLNFLLPEVFDALDVFESWFDVTQMKEAGAEERIVQQEQEKQVISTLHKILSPFLLRRVKNDVAIHLPPKRELLVYAQLTPLQLQLYTATLNRDINSLKKLGAPEEKVEYSSTGRPIRRSTFEKKLNNVLRYEEDDSEEGLERYLSAVIAKKFQSSATLCTKKEEKAAMVNVKLQNIMMQCRRIVNHPYLIAYPLTKDGDYKIDEELVTSCGKLQVLDQLLKELHSRGHKVLLFSQMTMLLEILEDYLSLRPQYSYFRLDGKVSLDDRQANINAFNKDHNVFLYLMSTRAGSLGINLTAADTVIIYDSDWNPQQDLQAQDRCHRIGQTRPVLVLRLVTAATIDERIVERASNKRCLEKLIMKAGHFRNTRLDKRDMPTNMDREELLKLLEERDHQGKHRTADNSLFSKEELNEILDRSELESSVRSTNAKSVCAKTSVFKIVQA